MALFSRLFGKNPSRSVKIEPAGVAFDVEPGATILERALAQGIAYPHDCTVGTCGSCRTRLVSGQVEAITPFGYTLSREELDAGYILACQALPKSDLVINVDIAGSGSLEPVCQPARLVEVTELTHDIRQVTLEVDTPLHFRAGQYANLSWGEGNVHRSYSFATPPSASGINRPGFFIRHVPGGLFTDRLFDGTLADLPLRIESPHGNFWLREGKGPIVCVAGGSGLAPVLSLLQDAASRRIRRDCILLFGGRTERDLYAAQAIAAVRSSWTASFDYWPVLSEETNPQFRQGFVTGHIAQALEKLGSDAQAYLCGPPAMIDAGISELTARGVTLADIFYDKFTDASTAG